MINDNEIVIDNLPDNDSFFLVIKYAAVTKTDSKSKIPTIQVILRKVNMYIEEFIANQTDTIAYIPMNELDIVKIGSVWQRKKLIKKKWHKYKNLTYNENLTFSFNFNSNTPQIVKYNEDIEELKNNLSNIYPVYIQHAEKKRLNFINKTKYTKIVDSKNEVNVLIPCMELFIATYAPNHKTIRQRFLQYDLDTAIDEFIIKDESYIDDQKYNIRVHKKMDDNNVNFLAYLLFNKTSRERANKLWLSLEKDEREYDCKVPIRYPEVLPFHPTIMDIDVDGIWLNQNVFLVLRINGRSIPNDFEVLPIRKKINIQINETDYKPYKKEDENQDSSDTNSETNEEDNEEDNEEESQTSNNIKNEKFNLDSQKTPHTRESTQRILTEVSVIGENKPLKYTSIEEEYTVDKHVHPNELSTNKFEVIESQNIESSKVALPKNEVQGNMELSSAESDLSQDSLGVNKLIFEPEKVNEITKKLFSSVIKALNVLLKQKKITSYKFIDKSLTSQISFTLTTFIDTMLVHKEQYNKDDFSQSWLRLKERKEGQNSFLGYREYLMIEIYIENKVFYLFEIGKKKKEGYSGLVFKSENNLEITSTELLMLLNKIILNKGNYLKKDEKDNFQSINLDVQYETYKHYFNQKTKEYSNLTNKIIDKIDILQNPKK